MSQTVTLLTTGLEKQKFQWDKGGHKGGEGSGHRHKIESLRGIGLSLLYEKSKKLVDTNLLSVAVVSKHTAVRLKVGSVADSNSGGSSNDHNHLVSSI